MTNLTWHAEPVGEFPQMTSPPASSFQGLFAVARPTDLKDERAVEVQIVKLPEKRGPVYFAIPRG